MRKLNDRDLGHFVTVHFIDEGKRDGILLEFLSDTDARVWFPASTDDDAPDVSTVDCNTQIVAIGPKLKIEFPRF
jgi:hypothetical protein